MPYRYIFIALSVLSYAGTTLAGYDESSGEDCFNAAFDDPDWMNCVQPIIQEIFEDFNITKLCLSSEVEATRCLFGKLNECFDVLSFIGIPPEVNSFINMSMMSNEEMVDVTCEVDGGQCDDIVMCDLFNDLPDEKNPMVGVVQVIHELCGPECIRKSTANCPNLVHLYRTSVFDNFTDNFETQRIEKTRVFMDETCDNKSEFNESCTIEQLKTSDFLRCYLNASASYPRPKDTLTCPLYNAWIDCLDRFIRPSCGQISSDLLKEAALISFSEITFDSCTNETSSGWQLISNPLMLIAMLAVLRRLVYML